MSNIYIQEPPTEGKVLMVTSAGDLDIELWSKETPKACRNFVQLCLEGYYNETIFHRVLPGFIVQGGDPTGTGAGGESIYGKPFKDEFHSRLRFVRRGLVAMANAGPNDNGSQFFITLGQCPELQNKHTIFGKIAGNTLYNLPRFEEGEIGKEDRPEFPQKVMKTEVLKNPFPDIIPRLKIENEIPKEKRKSKKKGTKNFKLLSFGDEAEEEEEEVLLATKSFSTKGNSAHDIGHDPTLSASTGGVKEDKSEELERIRKKLRKEDTEETLPAVGDEIVNEVKIEKEKEKEEEEENEDILQSREVAKAKKLAAMKAEVKQLKKDLIGKKDEKKEEIKEEEEDMSEETIAMRDYKKDREEYEEKKKQLPKKGTSREKQTLALLQRFRSKVMEAVENEDEGGEAVDDDDDDDDEENNDKWLRYRIKFNDDAPVLAKDASRKDEHWYDLDDPRNAINKRRREGGNKEANKRR
ncbi:spliceosome-associated protein CWC27 homolog [Oratosquilla oratoria]|uniref:spliceosome-associated protein CWC27 homolog n=1 Tax=Oratosquilla oratoria TaxID=337810 RepID=UPI003F76BA6F